MPRAEGAYKPLCVVYGVNPLYFILFPNDELVHKDANDKLKAMMKLHQQVCVKIDSVNDVYKRNSNMHSKLRVLQDGDLV